MTTFKRGEQLTEELKSLKKEKENLQSEVNSVKKDIETYRGKNNEGEQDILKSEIESKIFILLLVSISILLSFFKFT